MAANNEVFTFNQGISALGSNSTFGNTSIIGSINISGNLAVTGTLTYTASAPGSIIPQGNNYALGNTTNRWALYAENIDVANGSVVANGMTITGGLLVTGNSTFLSNLSSNGNAFTLNSGVTGAPALNGTFVVDRGTSANAILQWNEGANNWTIGTTASNAQIVTNSGTWAINITGSANTANNTTFFGGQNTAYWSNIVSLLGYTPANKAGDIFTGNVVVYSTGANTTGTLGFGTGGSANIAWNGTTFTLTGGPLIVSNTISASNGTFSAAVSIANSVTAGGGTLTNDLTIYRSAANTTGLIYFGNGGTKYLYWDASNFNLTGPLIVSGNVTSTYISTPDSTPGGTPTGIVAKFATNTHFTANASQVSTYLGLGTIATQNANNVNITGGSITGVTIPSATAGTGFTNLQIYSVDQSTIYVSADILILENSSYTKTRVNFQTLSFTPISGGTGAGGLDTGSFGTGAWYYIWVINNGTTTSLMASTSSTTPTMPSGYTYKLRVGSFYYQNVLTYPGTAIVTVVNGIVPFYQNGRRYQFNNTYSGIPQLIHNNTTGGVWTAFPVRGTYLPATAGSITFTIYKSGNNSALAAPNSNYNVTYTYSNPPPVIMAANAGSTLGGPFTFVLESNNIYLLLQDSGSSAYVLGFEDNL